MRREEVRGGVPRELERRFRLSDAVLRYLTVTLEPDWAQAAKEQAVRDAQRRAEQAAEAERQAAEAQRMAEEAEASPTAGTAETAPQAGPAPEAAANCYGAGTGSWISTKSSS